MAGTYTLANNTTLTDGNGGNGAVVNLTGKYADSVTNQNIVADDEIFYQGLFSLSTNTNRRANRESSLLLDTNSTGANTITDVAGYVLQMWVFIPFFTNHGVNFNVTNWAGVQAVVADGGTSGTANINTYRVDGNDNNVKGGWQLYVVDLRNTPTGQDSNLSVATLGSAGRAPRYVGWTHSTRGFALRRDPLAALDCARFGRMQLNVTGGTNSSILPSDPENSSAANFFQMADYDDYNDGGTPANGSAVDGGYHKFGICEPSLESNGYILRGVWSLGTSATATFFEDYNSAINVRDEFLTYTDFNRIEVRNAASTVNLINTNASLVFRNDVITSQNAAYAPAQTRGNFEMVDNATVAMTGCAWSDMGTFIFQSNATLADTTFRRNDLVTQGGATLTGCAFVDTDSGATESLVSTSTTLGLVTGCSFARTSGTVNAVRISDTISTATTVTWDGNELTGYGTGVTGTGISSTTGGAIKVVTNAVLTISVTNGATIPTVEFTGTGSVDVVASVSVSINVSDVAGVAVSGAQVAVIKTSDRSTLFNNQTNGSGVATFGADPSTPILVRVRKSDTADTPRYIAVETPSNTGATGASVFVTLIEDGLVGL